MNEFCAIEKLHHSFCVGSSKDKYIIQWRSNFH